MITALYVYSGLLLLSTIAAMVVTAQEIDDWEDAVDIANREYLERRDINP